ncbi:MAG TPA: tripartite tricarboxylate transporter substrate binding protein [Burkholderiales bacterium]|nr:tripartite tricarboxylate transporter substrate binding protein [Burkholderiales bacterium]
MSRFLAMATLLFCAALSGARAAEPAAKPLRIIVNLPPASSMDLVARALADAMSRDGGAVVFVENRPGAAGTLAAEAVARAAPDGKTLLVSGVDAIVFAFISANRKPFDPFTDFMPIARLTRDHWVLAVSPALGVNSVAELIAFARAHPGAVTYASTGNGGSIHLMGERFRQGAGIEAAQVPYKESYLPDLIAARVSYVVHITAAVGPHIKAGKLKGLAVFSAERIAYLPGVPSIAEAGFPNLEFNAGVALYAPGGTPRQTVLQLNKRVNRALASEGVLRRFAELGVDAVPGDPDDAARYVGENLARLRRMREATFGTP